jgi:hypothetical protein
MTSFPPVGRFIFFLGRPKFLPTPRTATQRHSDTAIWGFGGEPKKMNAEPRGRDGIPMSEEFERLDNLMDLMKEVAHWERLAHECQRKLAELSRTISIDDLRAISKALKNAGVGMCAHLPI